MNIFRFKVKGKSADNTAQLGLLMWGDPLVHPYSKGYENIAMRSSPPPSPRTYKQAVASGWTR